MFLAEDTRLDRKVAIKWLRTKAVASEQARKRLIREAKTAATLDHPNICTVHEIGEDGERAFIVMQYVEGETLADRLDSAPPDLRESVDIAAQVAEALIEAHSHGVVHRDIKPQNVIVTPRGQVKVLDFGLAKLLQLQPVDTEKDTQTLLTDAGMAIGTVHYMSPEQARGEHVDARSDVFALGALLYKCITGRSAFSGNNAIDVCAQVIHVDPSPPSQINPAVPFQLERIVLKALAKNIDARYQSADEMLSDLRGFQQASLKPRKKHLPQLTGKGVASLAGVFDRSRRDLRIRATVGIVLITILAAWLALHNRHISPHQPTPQARAWYEQGANALRDGSYYQASKLLEDTVGLDNNFALAHARLAEAYAELDYAVKAKDQLLIAQSLVPDRGALPQMDASYLKAISAVVTRDITTAIETYLQMVQQAPDADKPSLLFDLGRTYEKGDNLEKAIDTYLEVTRGDPQSTGAFLRLGVLYGRQQDSRNAEAAFNQAEKLYARRSNTEGQSEVLYQRGILMKGTGNLGDARAKLETSLRMSRDASNIYQQIRTLLVLSDVCWNEGNTVKAKEYATEAEQLAQNNDLRSLATNGLIDLGYAFMSRGELDESGQSLHRALDFAQADKAPLGTARALLALGNLSLQLDNPDEAIRFLTHARDFYQDKGYRRQASTCLLLLGRANRAKGEYAAALEMSQQQLDLARDLSDSSLVAAAHSNIGSILGIDQEKYSEGLIHIDESYRINDRLGDTLGTGYDLMARGRLLWPLGRYDEARAALNKAFSIANHPDASYKPLLAYVYLSNAQMDLSESRFAEARRDSEKALELAGNRNKDVTIQAGYTLGLTQALSGAPKAGKSLCEEAVNNARKSGSPRLLSMSLLALAEVLLKTGDAKDALRNALQAQASFERYGQQESESHAWLIAARASDLMGNPSALGYAERAAGVLSVFLQKWDPDAQRLYQRRADVKSSRNQIDRILRVRK